MEPIFVIYYANSYGNVTSLKCSNFPVLLKGWQIGVVNNYGFLLPIRVSSILKIIKL